MTRRLLTAMMSTIIGLAVLTIVFSVQWGSYDFEGTAIYMLVFFLLPGFLLVFLSGIVISRAHFFSLVNLVLSQRLTLYISALILTFLSIYPLGRSNYSLIYLIGWIVGYLFTMALYFSIHSHCAGSITDSQHSSKD